MVGVSTSRRAWSGRRRKGQSEVIGGLIVLTLLFMFAIPVIMNVYQATIQAGQEARQAVEAQRFYLNEKLIVQPVDPNSEMAQRAGWIPGVWINNTGTVAVTLDKLYLIDEMNNTIFAIFDLRTARPGISDLIKEFIIDPLEPTAYTPNYGDPVVLQPGQSLLIVFNETILTYAPNLYVLVESASGIMHPIATGGEAQTLYPGRPELTGPPGAWRGIFAPQSGFSLRGYDELSKMGIAYAWKPPIYVYPDRDDDWSYEPEDLSYYHTFIYEDPEYPGLYMLDIRISEWTYLRMWSPAGYDAVWVPPGYTIKLRGYVGTYDAGGNGYGTYFNGYAYAVEIYSGDDLVWILGPFDQFDDLGTIGIMESDFDGNNVTEVTFYSYLNGPNYATTLNIDADDDGSIYTDALVWTYMIARDISNIDYIKITVKMNYYWTTTFWGSGCPDWDVRRLKVFAIVVWKYDPATGEWRIHQYQNYGFTSEKPVQFQETAVFPVESNGTYRVGILVYDNYRGFDFGNFDCYTDFTLGLEHVIVEYGIYNPFFQESPPLYIVAIPDPDMIDGIGYVDYMNAYNITDPDVAKVRAQADLLAKLKEELDYAGVSGYTVIQDTSTLCNLLFSANPPKYAVIYWLQGNVSISYVTNLGGCGLSEYDMADMMEAYRWVVVFPFNEPFAEVTFNTIYDRNSIVYGPGTYEANITEAGAKIRKEAYAYYLFNTLPFQYVLTVSHPIWNATLYAYNDTTTNTLYPATVAFWLETDGDPEPEPAVIVVNPVHIDWDISGDGVIPETLVQQIVYSSLTAWMILVTQA